MKKLRLILFFCFVYSIAFLQQTKKLKSNDTLNLCLDGYKFGNIQWQISEDSITWNNIPGANYNCYPYIITNGTYYFRAIVTSETCNPFISEVKKIEINEFHCGDTLIDERDGQKYPTVLIGGKCFMAKNINIGKMIINGSQYQTNNNIIEKYCYSNDSVYCSIYGGLYTWDEAMQYTNVEMAQGICPDGWHIPTDYEWIKVEMELGMDSLSAYAVNAWRGTDQGTQLKLGGTSGYDALLSGRAIPGGYFDLVGQYEFMYTSSEYGSNAWRRCLRTGDPTVGRWNTFPKSYALSVRCVKNE